MMKFLNFLEKRLRTLYFYFITMTCPNVALRAILVCSTQILCCFVDVNPPKKDYFQHLSINLVVSEHYYLCHAVKYT